MNNPIRKCQPTAHSEGNKVLQQTLVVRLGRRNKEKLDKRRERERERERRERKKKKKKRERERERERERDPVASCQLQHIVWAGNKLLKYVRKN